MRLDAAARHTDIVCAAARFNLLFDHIFPGSSWLTAHGPGLRVRSQQKGNHHGEKR